MVTAGRRRRGRRPPCRRDGTRRSRCWPCSWGRRRPPISCVRFRASSSRSRPPRRSRAPTRYGEWRRAPEGHVPAFTDFDAALAQSVVSRVLARGGGWARPAEAQALLAAAGIASADAAMEASDEEAAVQAATTIGYPGRAQGVRPDHRPQDGTRCDSTESCRMPRTSRSRFRPLESDAGRGDDGRADSGDGRATAWKCWSAPSKIRRSGPVVACALGGTTAELFADSAFGLAPLTDLDARIDDRRVAMRCRYCAATAAPRRRRGGAARGAAAALGARHAVPGDSGDRDQPAASAPRGVKALDVRARIERPRQRPNLRRVQY